MLLFHIRFQVGWSQDQGYGLLQHRDIDVVPDIRFGRQLSNLLHYAHVFRKDQAKYRVGLLPLHVISKAYEEFRA